MQVKAAGGSDAGELERGERWRLWVTSDVYARFGKKKCLDRFILWEDPKLMIIEKRSQNQWKTGEKLYPAVRKWRLITGSERPTI
jgi:hypothetical protein